MHLDKLKQLIEPGIEALGYELVHVELTQSGKDPVLRVYIDALGGIQVEDCERVSRDLSVLFDVEDPLPNAYLLEVSSPGLDRPLTKANHFQRVVGDKVKVVMRGYVLGRRRFTGKLIEAKDDYIVVDVDGEAYELSLAEIESARLQPEFDF